MIMPKKKDASAKAFFSYNDILADLLNWAVFGWKAVDPEALSDRKSSWALSKENRLLEVERDVYMLWSLPEGGKIASGIEIQSRPDKTMPARIKGYDGADYQKQLVDARTARKKRKEKAALPEEQEAAVATIVVYIGTERPWNTASSLSDSYGIPEKYAKPLHLDQPMLLFDAGALEDEVIERMNSDFKYIAGFIKSVRNHEPFAADDTMKLVHREAFLRLLAALKGADLDENEVRQFFEDEAEERTVKTMISFLSEEEKQDILSLGLARGRKEGRTEGRAESGRLYSWLIMNGRTQDALEATRSEKMYQHLYEEMEKATAKKEKPALLN